MDLTSLITTIISSTAALVAIIGGFLVSRVISLENDQSFLKRRLDDISLSIKNKEELLNSIKKYLFEDDLEDFVTLSNLILMIKNYSLEEIIKEDEYALLTREQLEPYFKILVEIKEEVYEIINKDDFTSELFEEILNKKEVKYPERIEWYELMLKAYVETYTQRKPWDFPTPALPSFNSNYKHKQREGEQLEYELKLLESQKTELQKNMNEYLETKWVWVGIGVLIYSSIIGILYPATLLPYPQNYYNDEQTKFLLLIFFGSCLIAIFIFLIVAVSKIAKMKTKKV